jgi:hypothetical protein
MCTPNGQHSKLVFSQNTTGYIYGTADVIGIHGPWGKYGGAAANRTFSGRFSCAFLPGTTNPYPFIIMARGARTAPSPGGAVDKRLFFSRGQWNATQAAPAPTSLTQWAAIDGTSYNTHGTPAVASNSTSLVVVYLNDAGQLRGNYWDAASNTFSSPLSAPALPNGWTGLGTPAVAWTQSPTSTFHVFVRTRNGAGQLRLYRTSMHTTAFAAGWERIDLPANAPPMDSDPAFEFNANMDINTLYYRRGTTLYQLSSLHTVYSSSTIKAIRPQGNATPSFTGNPSVIGGVPYETGRHWVLARATGGIYFASSMNDEDLAPN